MRLIALLLLLGNVAFWGYVNYLAPRLAADPLAQQVQPEKLRLMTETEVAQLPAPDAPACVAYGPIEEAKLRVAKDVARTLHANVSMAERYTEEGMVLELRTPNEALRKQLKELLPGVSAVNCQG